MVIVQINQTYKIGSTGKIMNDLNEVIIKSGHESYMVAGYSNGHNPYNLFCTNTGNSYIPIRKDQIIFRITGNNGYRYKRRTQELVEWIESKHPDIIHLHNIHGDWIHIETLFDYIKKYNIHVVWTLHDCWAFTGRCSYFDICGCEKWKTQCHDCPNRKVYPITYFFDHSAKMYQDKKRWFTSIDRMTIVTPSEWLAQYAQQSYLGKYPVQVIHNGIDTSIFMPQPQKSKYFDGIGTKKIILGVASTWSSRKGFDDFIKLDSLLNHEQYQIVLVGLNDRQLKTLPDTIIGITRTNNQQELAEIYSGADVFINPTYQDNYPTTNLEAQCCGTPCVTYQTGGSPESVFDLENVIKQGDVQGLLNRVYQICEMEKQLDVFDMINRFDKDKCFLQYIRLYDALV